MKIIFDTETGKATTEQDGEIIEDFVCFDFRCSFDKSEARFYYWPKSKKDRKEAQRQYKKTGLRPI
jgi:hypothetical protein